MAEVFWVHVGSTPVRTSKPHHVSINEILDKLAPYEKRYSPEPPAIDPPKKGGDHAHGQVVVRVNEEEINSNYPDEGYYHIVELTPIEARELLGIRSVE
jgi:hypothetical protein